MQSFYKVEAKNGPGQNENDDDDDDDDNENPLFKEG